MHRQQLIDCQFIAISYRLAAFSMHITQDKGSRGHRNTAYRIHKFLYPAETMHTV